jgi:hypothetical protein
MLSAHPHYQNRPIALFTQHGKEKVLTPSNTPGFWIVERIAGLSRMHCGAPTRCYYCNP